MASTDYESRGSESTVRTSITFTQENYAILESMARAKKVSLAWVVRDAVDRYISDQWPLLQSTGRGQP